MMDRRENEMDAGKASKEVFIHLQKGNARPCYLLYGEETFLLDTALKKIIDLILKDADRELNLFYMDGDHEDMQALCQSLMTPPLIAGSKVVVLRNTHIFHSVNTLSELISGIRIRLDTDPDRAAKDFMRFLGIMGWSLDDLRNDGWRSIHDHDWKKALSAEGDKNLLETWLPGMIEHCINLGLKEEAVIEGAEMLGDILKKGLPEGNHLIMTAGVVDKRKKIFKVISEMGAVLHFPQIKYESRKKQALMDTARDILSRAGKTMTPGAWEAMGHRTGFVMDSSVEALEKLITYTGDRSRIEEKDVDAVVGKSKEGNIFDLTNAISEKNLNRALVALKDLFDQGIHHMVIMSMMAKDIRFLAQASILISGGSLSDFDPKMDYGRFQRSVYPVIRTWAEGVGKKEWKGDLIRQNPYVIYQAMKNSCRFSFDVLVGYLEDLVDMDMALKSTARDPRFMLERFLIKVCM